MKEKLRLSPLIQKNIVIQAKSKAALEEKSLQLVIEELLVLWIENKIDLNTKRPPK